MKSKSHPLVSRIIAGLKALGYVRASAQKPGSTLLRKDKTLLLVQNDGRVLSLQGKRETLLCN